jgi:hypothetical protein
VPVRSFRLELMVILRDASAVVVFRGHGEGVGVRAGDIFRIADRRKCRQQFEAGR